MRLLRRPDRPLWVRRTSISSIPSGVALLTAIWIGILPGVTKIHLDGFFAQSSILFVFPALIAAFRFRLARTLAGSFVLTVLLTYLFCAYTEFYPLGVVAVVGLLAVTLWPSLLGALIRGAFVITASLLLSAPYLGKGFRLLLQHGSTSLLKPESLESLVPDAGTVRGWSVLLFGDLPAASRITVLLTVVLLLMVVSAFFTSSLKRRLELAVIAGVAVGPLALIVSLPGYPKYLFWKLSGTFAWLLAILAVVGMTRVLSVVKIRGSYRRACLAACVLVPVAVSAAGFKQQMGIVFSRSDNLRFVDTPYLRKTFDYVENHPGQTYLIAETNGIVAGWFMYHARNSRTYIDPSTPAGDYIPVGKFAFYEIPAELPEDTQVLSRLGRSRLTPLVLKVENPQGIDRDGARYWYWMGDQIDLKIKNSRPTLTAWLSLRVAPGPANRAPGRVMAIDDGVSHHEFDFRKEETIGTEVQLVRGMSTIRLRTVRPCEHQVKLPNDPRKHMIWVADVSIREISP